MRRYGNIELINGEIINFIAERVSSDPVFTSSDEGKMIYNTTDKEYKFNNGSAWVVFQISLTDSDELIDSLGQNWINSDFSFDPTDFNTLSNVSGVSDLYDVIVDLDTAITEAKNVSTLQSVDLDFTEGDLVANNIIYYNGTNFIPGTINDLDTIDLSFSELNDISFAALSSDQIVVREGSSWVNKPLVFQYQELSGTNQAFTINHDLGTQFCDVTVIDMSTNPPQKINPSLISSIQYNSSTTLTLNLTQNNAVTVIVVGLELS